MPSQGPCAHRNAALNSKSQHCDRQRQRESPWKQGKIVYFSTFSGTFFLLSEQGVPYFQLAPGSAKSVAGPGDRDG